MKYFKYWTADVKWRKLWSSQLWKQFMQLRIQKPAKSQDFNGVWTCDPTRTVRCSNQPSYEATDVGSWSYMDWALFLCPSNVVTPVFHHESTPHLLLDTNSVCIIQFLLVGDWFVQQTPNKPQTQWERDVMQMWATIFLWEHCVTGQNTAAKETFRPFFLQLFTYSFDFSRCHTDP